MDKVIMDKNELIERIKELAPEGVITCTAAHQLIEKLNLECAAQVGKACNEANIKVCGCELGCFK